MNGTVKILALALLAGSAHADPYLGLQVGQSQATIDHPGAVLTSFNLTNTATVGRLSLGYEAERWGLELGYTPLLSRRTGHAVIAAAGIDMRQEIKTSAADVRGFLGLNLSRDFQARLIGGLAWVYFESHELGVNPVPAEWRNSGTQLAPLYGVGLRYQISKNIGLTVDFTQIPGVAKSHWTMESDITSVMAGLTVKLH